MIDELIIVCFVLIYLRVVEFHLTEVEKVKNQTKIIQMFVVTANTIYFRQTIRMKNTLRLLSIICMMVVTTVNVYSQETFTVSGYITDQESGETLISANVFEAKNSAGSVSNLYGFYSMTLPKDSIYLSFSYIGFQPQTVGIYLDSDVELNIQLSSSVALQEVEIVANRASEAIQEKSQMSVIEVPIAQIKKMPALLGEVDVLKALQLLPGVQSGGEGQSGLYVRGGSPDQNLILLDGVPVYNVNHLFGFFSVFNADAIKDVKLTKGGYPARYGGRLSSVLEINMKEGNMKEFAGAGSIGLISSKLSLEGPIIKDKASFIVSGRRTYIDLLARPLIKRGLSQNEGQSGNAGYYFYDVNAKVNYKISDKDRLYLSTYFGDDQFFFETNEEIENEYSQAINTELGWGNLTSALRWNHKWSNRMFSNVTATYTKYNFGTLVGTDNRSFDQSGVEEDRNAFAAGYDSGISDWALRVDFDFIPNPNHYIKFGGLGIRHSFTPGEFKLDATVASQGQTLFALDTIFGQQNVNTLEYNVFVEDDHRITPTLKANYGLHFSGFNVNETNYVSLQPRISLRQLLPGDVALKASFATMRQYVQFLTNENIGLPWDQWLPTTKDVKPQDSWQVALGVAKTIGNDYEVSIEGYYKEMKNLIAYEDGASLFSLDPWESQVTQGEGKSYGAEFFLQKKFGKFTGWAGYTLSWSWRRFDDKNFGEWYPYKFDRRNDVSLVGIYELSDRINLAATWVYGTGNSVTFADSRVPILVDTEFFGNETFVDYFKSRNANRLPSFHRLDVNIDFIKQKKNHKRIWSIGAYNAYSRKNPFFVQFESDFKQQDDGTFAEETVLKQYSLFPIIPSVSYRFEF